MQVGCALSDTFHTDLLRRLFCCLQPMLQPRGTCPAPPPADFASTACTPLPLSQVPAASHWRGTWPQIAMATCCFAC